MCRSVLRHPRHPLFCIIPPYILRSIAQQGSASQRAKAMQTLSIGGTFQAMRLARSMAAPRVQQPRTLPGEPQKQRSIFDAQNTQTIPGVLVRTEGGPSNGDQTADEAYDGLGATYDLFLEVFDRNSIDDEGMPLNATIHFGQDFINAFWDGQRMVFGDGDPDLGFNRFTIALDVIGHELAHGVTEDEGPLIYTYQSGALNESMSDVFGSLVKQKALNQTADQADWLIGAGLFMPSVQGVALRSMQAPGTAFDDPVLGKDPQPDHMSQFVRTYEDNGGVHINSGIPNRAFYLAATALGGYAWETAGPIWYDTLRDSRLRPNTGLRRFARLTIDNARRSFGTGSTEQDAIREAWRQVGIVIT